MTKKIKIYISGPITGTNDYMERFSAAEKIITEAGFSAVNPAKVNAMLPEDTTHDEYMEMSLTMLSMCDMIFMLDGWKESVGAKIEWEYAVNNGLGMMYEDCAKYEYLRTVAKLSPAP